MPTEELIAAEEFCSYYSINLSFIKSLQQLGLVQLILVEEKPYIPDTQLPKIEQLIRHHFDLHINDEGLDVVSHLLEKVKNLNSEVALLKNRLKLYENFS